MTELGPTVTIFTSKDKVIMSFGKELSLIEFDAITAYVLGKKLIMRSLEIVSRTTPERNFLEEVTKLLREDMG